MGIQKEFKGEEGIFFLEEEGERVAKMFVRLVGTDRFSIEHTEVTPRLKGRGVGNSLVGFAVEFARENNLKIIPLCHFAKKVLQATDEYHDVL